MQNKKRAAEIKNFLSAKANIKGYTLVPLNNDASSRNYFRIFLKDGTTKVLLDDEGCKNKPKEFFWLSKFLNQNKIRAPKIFFKDLSKGFMLIEDFGNTDYVVKIKTEDQKTLLKKAVNILVKLHKVKTLPPFVKSMDDKVILDNFALFTDWYMPSCLNQQLSLKARTEFFTIIKKLLPLGYNLPETLVLWDYHADNVMYPDDSEEAAIIDFQDALRGPGLYDLVSLIEDERREIPSQTTFELKEHYFSQLSNISRTDFENAYAFMALLRHMRVLGRFTTLIEVTRKPTYAKYVPHGLELLKNTLQNPLFSELKSWFNQYFPENLWCIPQDKKINKAFVLAAGRGVRMRHLTEKSAKPMVEVAGRKLMDYGLDLLQNAKISNIIVNVCWCKDQIKKYVHKLKNFNINISEEKEALETGGGIKKALHFFENNPFVVINADNILIDSDYKPIINQMTDVWNDSKHDVLLLLTDIANVGGDTPKHGDYKIKNGRIFRNKQKISAPEFKYTYVGVAIIHPRAFTDSPKDKFSLLELFDKAEAENRLGFALSPCKEFLVGSPEAVTKSEKALKTLK